MIDSASEEELPFILTKHDSRVAAVASFRTSSPYKIRTVYILVLAASVVLNVILLLRPTTPLLFRASATSTCQTLYSPATEAIEYQPVKFTRGFGGEVPVYEQDPSPEVDAAWDALWMPYERVSIPRSQAALLSNKTWPILGDEDNFITGLEVFHQLHCLDTLRMASYPEHYPNPDFAANHLRHCVGHLRQTIMCFGDVTPIAMQWTPSLASVLRRDEIMHSCKDFSRLQEWSRAHHIDNDEKDFAVFIDDPLAG